MIRARFSPRAERDLDEICDYIAADNADAAIKVRQTILDTADFLALNSALGRRILKAPPATRPSAGLSCRNTATT